jgi:hypothetical protein
MASAPAKVRDLRSASPETRVRLAPHDLALLSRSDGKVNRAISAEGGRGDVAEKQSNRSCASCVVQVRAMSVLAKSSPANRSGSLASRATV